MTDLWTFAITFAAMMIACVASADDWIERPHPWVALRFGAFVSGGREAGHLVSDRRNPTGGPFSRLDLGYGVRNGGEIAVGHAFTSATEVQALYTQTSLDFGGDSLTAPGDTHLADATAHMLMAGIGWSGRFSIKRWGALGDGLASAAVLGGVAWAGSVRPTDTAVRLGLREITGRTSLAAGIDGRLDQRFYRGLVGSVGMRLCHARRLLHVEPDLGSIYRPADVGHTSVFFSLGLSYWY
jgi:hypothetical protein